MHPKISLKYYFRLSTLSHFLLRAFVRVCVLSAIVHVYFVARTSTKGRIFFGRHTVAYENLVFFFFFKFCRFIFAIVNISRCLKCRDSDRERERERIQRHFFLFPQQCEFLAMHCGSFKRNVACREYSVAMPVPEQCHSIYASVSVCILASTAWKTHRCFVWLFVATYLQQFYLCFILFFSFCINSYSVFMDV